MIKKSFYKNIIFYITLILIFFFVILYSLEIALSFWNHSSLKAKKWKKLDRSRYSYYVMQKKINPEVVITISPSNFVNDKNIEVYPLAGIHNSLTINCNELGFWSKFNSDKFGFNNSNDDWNKDRYKFLLLGDSFLLGDCVNSSDNISNQLRKSLKETKKNDKYGVLNIGYGGNGSLIENATLREYFPNAYVENVLLLYYDANDLTEFFREIKNPLLKKYLDDKNFKQNLVDKNFLINKILKEKLITLTKEEEEKIKKNKLIRFNEIRFNKLLILTNLRHRLTWQFNLPLISDGGSPRVYESHEVELIKKNFLQIQEFSKSKGSKFYFVFLPGFPAENDGEFILKIIKDLKIPVINVKKEIFDNHPDKLSLFPNRAPNHYTPEGYKLISDLIIKSIN